jgi:hypothetical protein
MGRGTTLTLNAGAGMDKEEAFTAREEVGEEKKT